MGEVLKMVEQLQQSTEISRDEVVHYFEETISIMALLTAQVQDAEQHTASTAAYYREANQLLLKRNDELARMVYRSSGLPFHQEATA